MKHQLRLLAVAGVTSLFSLSGATSSANADPAPLGSVDMFGQRSARSVENVGSGLSYGNWSGRWWEWLLSIPAATNPNLSTGNVDCSLGQAGDVWFLGGTFGGAAERSCAVPHDRALFFPMITTIVLKPEPNETLNNLRQQAAAFVDRTKPGSLRCTIDGAPCAFDLKRFRATSPAFTIIPPKDGVLPQDYFTARPEVVSDGYWMMLNPLPPRPAPYVIRFGGASGDTTIDVTYRFFVKR